MSNHRTHRPTRTRNRDRCPQEPRPKHARRLAAWTLATIAAAVLGDLVERLMDLLL